ncbi:MAG: retroviral-like aspartic protease family protein [Tepidiformaceae bacterium]
MGKVIVDITLANRGDEIGAERRLLALGDVRSFVLHDVLVDTGASTISLPARMITRLGLTFAREVGVFTATGVQRARVFRDISVTIMGRSGSFECLELPDEAQPLLGVFPLEALGIELDLQHERLVLLPPEAYLSI